jgi:hypothetical protein
VTVAGLLAVGLAVPACTGNSSSPSNPPSFGGITFHVLGGAGSGTVTLYWNPAVDFVGGGIVYFIGIGVSGSGTEDFSNPVDGGPHPFGYRTSASSFPYTGPGALGFQLTGLIPTNQYAIMVHAEDADGQFDANGPPTGEIIITAP